MARSQREPRRKGQDILQLRDNKIGRFVSQLRRLSPVREEDLKDFACWDLI